MSHFDLLVRKVEQCCDDGISCNQCPVEADCQGCWDRVCERLIITKGEYKKYLAELVLIGDLKRISNENRKAVPLELAGAKKRCRE